MDGMSGLCKDCRHWDGTAYSGEAGWCRLTASYENEPERPESLAVVESMDEAILRTSPDFGCVQFEERQHE